jgi:hypothetical protein
LAKTTSTSPSTCSVSAELDNNQYIASTQVTFRAGAAERRPDLVLYVNGIPLALLEAKTPVRNAVSWVDGAKQLHDDYEKFIPELFACNVLNVATEGKDLRYGAIHTPLEHWSPWIVDSLKARLTASKQNQASVDEEPRIGRRPSLISNNWQNPSPIFCAPTCSSTFSPTSPSSPPTKKSAASKSSAATSSTKAQTKSSSACSKA